MTRTTRRPMAALLSAAGFAALSTGVLNVADDLVAVLALGAGTVQVGWLNAVSSAVFLVFSVPVGWWLDVVDRRRTLMATQALATLALLSVPVAWLFEVLTFGQLLVTSSLVGLAGMVWGLGISTLLPTVSGRDKAGSAFARLQGIETTAGLVAPGLTGLLIAVLAAPMALFFAAAFELFAGLSLIVGARRSAAEKSDTSPTARPKFWAGVAEGFHFVIKQRSILLLTCSSALINFSLALTSAVETVYWVHTLGFEPQVIGAIGVVIAGSALVGSLIADRLLLRFKDLNVSVCGAIVATVGAVALPIASYVPGFGWAFGWVMVHIVIWNAAMMSANSGVYGIVARATPDRLMGRVQSFRRLISRGALPIASILGGFLGEGLGVVPTLWIGVAVAGLGAVATVAVWWLVRKR
ncbi:MFS transporter [Galactobacter sp.]|uniref:MFS transporter n=1 Tax=Galactobacter sp. TaxID=2676125 RepID=UPI0025BE04B0|nr:MFS transporter [Galactobacter sp.]